MRDVIALLLCVVGLLVGCRGDAGGRGSSEQRRLPTTQQAMDASRDVWGEAALRQPNGASYEFFEPLLAPLRYVDAYWRHYPIVLSAPRAPVKARFISNGSGMNLLARQPNWIGESGVPVRFSVGRDLHLYGSDVTRLEGPRYLDGYLPVVQTRYTHRGQTFSQEVFAPVHPELAKLGVAFVRVGMPEGPAAQEGKFEVQFEGVGVPTAKDGVMRSSDGKVLACFDPQAFEFIPSRATLNAWLKPGQTATLAIFTSPPAEPPPSLGAVDASTFDAYRARCVETWNKLLAAGMNISVPEPRVNDAWRACLIGNFILINENYMRYSHGNQYAGLYIGEGGDATRAMALYGHTDTARDVMRPLFAADRKGLEFHRAAFKLQMLAHVYFLTRDAAFVRSMRKFTPTTLPGKAITLSSPGWQHELDILLNGREPKTGLYPPEKYAGDLEDRVYSLNSNANGWRALRDISVVLAEVGETELSKKVAASAEELRGRVMDALEKSIRRDISPPFVPVALFGAEEPYGQIVEKRLGSYWNIMIKYVLGSGVFAPDSEYADAIINYMQQRAGLMMGMNRSRGQGRSHHVHELGINELYGMRYTLALLRRDEPEHALVSFYGKLAHGMTRDTYIGGEGASITSIDEHGRQLFLPPNSAANANYLQPLRYLLVQDYDMDDDGRAETLRLAFATPRRWLEDGKRIVVKNAPSEFGPVSFTIESRLTESGETGRIVADLDLPAQPRPRQVLVRFRLPRGWRITSSNHQLLADGETIDLSIASGPTSLVATVSR